MTEGVYALPCLFPNGNNPRLATPQARRDRAAATPFPSAHTGERGRQSYDMSRAEKKDHTINNDKKLPHAGSEVTPKS